MFTPFIPPFTNVSNIAPFTYKDAQTYLADLDAIRLFVNKELVTFVNNNSDTLGEFVVNNINNLITEIDTALTNQDIEVDQKINDLTEYIDSQVALIISESVITNDTIVKAILENLASQTRVYANTIFAAKSIETIVTSGRLSDASLIAEFAVKSIETTVNSGRLSDANLIAEFAVKSIETIVTSGRLSNTSLESQFALKSIETIVTSGRLSVISLDLEYANAAELNKYGINQFTTVALLIASTPASGNQTYASALNAPGALFRYDTTWKQYGDAVLADSTARDSVFTNTVLTALGVTAKCYLTTPKMRMENTNSAATISTWNKVGVLRPTSAVVSAGNGSSVINDDGSITVTFTAAGNVIIRDCIAPINLTDITDVDINWKSGAAQQLTMKQSSGGVVDPVTTGYDSSGQTITQAGVAAAALTTLNATAWIIQANGSSGIEAEWTVFQILHALDSTKATRIRNLNHVVITSGTSELNTSSIHGNRATTAFDGLQIASTGAGVLTLKFRPRV